MSGHREESSYPDRLLTHARTLVTLLVLAVVLAIGVAWGFHQATKPYPGLISDVGNGTCVDRPVARGDSITPDTVTVSVINGGTRDGLAARTIDDLTGDGFARGRLGNATDKVKVATVEIWTRDKSNPAVRLVRSYLGKQVVIKDADAGAPGVGVVVGDDFKGVVKGRDSLIAHAASSVCGP